jgi:hypothetical protein
LDTSFPGLFLPSAFFGWSSFPRAVPSIFSEVTRGDLVLGFVCSAWHGELAVRHVRWRQRRTAVVLIVAGAISSMDHGEMQ